MSTEWAGKTYREVQGPPEQPGVFLTEGHQALSHTTQNHSPLSTNVWQLLWLSGTILAEQRPCSNWIILRINELTQLEVPTLPNQQVSVRGLTRTANSTLIITEVSITKKTSEMTSYLENTGQSPNRVCLLRRKYWDDVDDKKKPADRVIRSATRFPLRRWCRSTIAAPPTTSHSHSWLSRNRVRLKKPWWRTEWQSCEWPTSIVCKIRSL